jgi:hypothetical protein
LRSDQILDNPTNSETGDSIGWRRMVRPTAHQILDSTTHKL